MPDLLTTRSMTCDFYIGFVSGADIFADYCEDWQERMRAEQVK